MQFMSVCQEKPHGLRLPYLGRGPGGSKPMRPGRQRSTVHSKAKEGAISKDEKCDGWASENSTPPPATTTMSPLSNDPHERLPPLSRPLDHSSTYQPDRPQPLPSALATARHIQDLAELETNPLQSAHTSETHARMQSTSRESFGWLSRWY